MVNNDMKNCFLAFLAVSAGAATCFSADIVKTDAYRWHGLGQSILDPRKQGVAVGSVMNVEGTGSDKEVERLKEAHTVSDYMLRYDWLKRLD